MWPNRNGCNQSCIFPTNTSGHWYFLLHKYLPFVKWLNWALKKALKLGYHPPITSQVGNTLYCKLLLIDWNLLWTCKRKQRVIQKIIHKIESILRHMNDKHNDFFFFFLNVWKRSGKKFTYLITPSPYIIVDKLPQSFFLTSSKYIILLTAYLTKDPIFSLLFLITFISKSNIYYFLHILEVFTSSVLLISNYQQQNKRLFFLMFFTYCPLICQC